MKTGKIFLLMAVLLVETSMKAQTPITFGVKAGVNVSNFSGDMKDSDPKIGFNVGITADYELTSDLYLLTGLELTTKGSKTNVILTSPDNVDRGKITEKMNPMYLQLPAHLGYKLTIAEGAKVVLHAGPYAAYGIGGKIKLEAKEDGVKSSTKMNFFQKDGFRRFDFGLGLGANAEFGKVGIGLGWDFGLVSLFKSDIDMKTMNGYLTIGYKF